MPLSLYIILVIVATVHAVLQTILLSFAQARTTTQVQFIHTCAIIKQDINTLALRMTRASSKNVSKLYTEH